MTVSALTAHATTPMTPASAGSISPSEMRHFILRLRALAALAALPGMGPLTRGACGRYAALCTLLEPEAPLEEQLACPPWWCAATDAWWWCEWATEAGWWWPTRWCAWWWCDGCRLG